MSINNEIRTKHKCKIPNLLAGSIIIQQTKIITNIRDEINYRYSSSSASCKNFDTGNNVEGTYHLIASPKQCLIVVALDMCATNKRKHNQTGNVNHKEQNEEKKKNKDLFSCTEINLLFQITKIKHDIFREQVFCYKCMFLRLTYV